MLCWVGQFSIESRKRAESDGEEERQHSSYLLPVPSCPHPTVLSFHWVFCCTQFCLASNGIGNCKAACQFGYNCDDVLYFYYGSSRHSFIVLRDKIFSFGRLRCDQQFSSQQRFTRGLCQLCESKNSVAGLLVCLCKFCIVLFTLGVFQAKQTGNDKEASWP